MLPGQLAITFPLEQPRGRPPEPIARSADIGGDGNTLRWSLHRAWAAGANVAWAGLNPSTADGATDDPTMWREMGFSYSWRFGSLVKVNIYPFRSPSPAMLQAWLSAAPRVELLADAARRAAAAIARCDLFVAAWGNGANATDLERWLRRVDHHLGRSIAWHCLGTNADGSPRHTLSRGRSRIPDTAQPELWRSSHKEHAHG